MTIRIDIIAGARPNFVKIAPLMNAFSEREVEVRLIHTGQHYDSLMSDTFFDQLGIRSPDINLNVGSGSQAQQTGSIMLKYEELLQVEKSDLCIVVGDVNSTLACSITAKKMGMPIAHIEAGIRSGDMSMPEEINRIVTDSITDYFFTTTEEASCTLEKLGVETNRIFFVGNIMIDTLLSNINRLRAPDFIEKYNLADKDYLVTTLHRPSNVDDNIVLQKMIDCISSAAGEMPIIFPAHPRIFTQISSGILLPKNFFIVKPQPYLQFNWLVKNALGVITDSGGVTEEATVLGVPCITLRDSTERPETVSIGTNILAGTNLKDVDLLIRDIIFDNWKDSSIPDLWDGCTAKRIVEVLLQQMKS